MGPLYPRPSQPAWRVFCSGSGWGPARSGTRLGRGLIAACRAGLVLFDVPAQLALELGPPVGFVGFRAPVWWSFGAAIVCGAVRTDGTLAALAVAAAAAVVRVH